MRNHSFSILTTHQKEILEQFLALGTDNEETLSLTELEGFLFGLAITPELIPPSEWIPEIFGGEDPVFRGEKEANLYIKTLIEAYNAYSKAFHKDLLKFPFNIMEVNSISDDLLNEIADWSYGLLLALEMRPELWYLDYKDGYEKAAEDVQEIQLSYCIVAGVVNPEEACGLFRKDNDEYIDEDLEIVMFFGLLPKAVEVLKEHGQKLWKSKVEEMNKVSLILIPEK